MKPVTITSKKLKLTRESLRLLDAVELKAAAGGKPDNTGGPCGTSFRICA